MALTFIPREKNAIDRFTEGFAPYLQMAMETMYRNKIVEQQRQKAISDLGIGREQLTPQGEQYVKSLPLSAQVYQGANPGQQPLSSIPEKYKTMGLDMNKASQLPINMDMGGGVTYKSPAIDPYTAMVMKNLGFGGQGQEAQGQGNLPQGMGSPEITLSGGKPKVTLNSPAQQKLQMEQTEKTKQLETSSQFVKDSALDTLNTIGEVEKGMGEFGLTGPVPAIWGTPKVNWQSNIDKLLSGKVIDLMTQMKQASKTGATGFGQLSEKELAVLQEASTALKKSLPPEEAQRYLNVMKEKLQKIVGESQGTQQQLPPGFSSDEWEIVQ